MLFVPVAQVAPADSGPQAFEQALVSSEGLDAARFDAAMKLRLPDVALRRQWDQQTDALGRFVFVHVARRDARLSVEVITAEGQAFVRTVEVDEQPERVAASFVASLVTSIEHAQVEADRDEVLAPVTSTEGDVQEAVREARAEPEPAPVQEAKPEPEPTPQPAPQPEPETPERPTWQLEVTPSFGVLLGLVPIDFEQRLGGGGGQLSVMGRSPRSVLVGGSVRAYGRAIGTHDLVRVRVAAAVGYLWTWDKAALAVGGSLGASSWSLRRDGARISASDLGAQSTLVNLAAWISGGPSFALERGPLRAVRFGARAELGGGFALSHGARAVAIFDAEGNDLFRIGGLELTVGLDATLTFGH